MISSAAVLGRDRLEQLPLVGVVGKGHHALRDRVAGGLVARDGQRDDEHAELGIGEALALGVGLDQRRDNVVTRLFGLAGRQLHGVPHHFARRGQRVVVRELRVVASDHLVGPVEQLATVFRRNPEQAGDRLQRQLGGHLKDEVARALLGCALCDLLRTLTKVGPQPLDGARSEAAGDDLAQPAVFGVVHHDHRRPAGFDLALRLIFRVARHDGLLGRREDVGAQRDLADVAVLGHHPVAAVAEPALIGRLLIPPDRRRAAQLGQLLHGQPMGVDLGIGEVETWREVRRGHGSLLGKDLLRRDLMMPLTRAQRVGNFRKTSRFRTGRRGCESKK